MESRKFKKILITGINGSVGSYLSDFLLKKKIHILGTYRNNITRKQINNISKKNLFKLDLNNFTRTKKVLKKIKPDLIFHLASNADVRKSFDQPREIILNNNNCTLNLLEALRITKINPLIIISSTSEVYGNCYKKIIDENQKIQPNNPYAVSKTFQDLLSYNYYKIYGLKIIITRMFTYLNAKRDNLFASSWAKQISQIEKGNKKTLFHGNLNTSRAIMSMEDAIKAYWLVALKGKIGEIYNIGGGKNIKLSNFLKILKSLSKHKIICKVDKKLLRKTDIKTQIPSAKKFFKRTNWKPEASLKRSLEKFLNEIRNSS
tara:strand:- start:847 stop:1800 length:954 start_codon:yes stop_codon:yes gene_type:complete